MNDKECIRPIELLSPAKNLVAGIAAINHGADAVYIGAPKFGARTAAGNSLTDIAQLVNYAHRYWAKVYVALNTILFDDELDEALTLVRSIYEAGTDAIIIQDMGLLELDLPPIPLFASTQTHNYSIKKIQFLEKVGFQRVILARELSFMQVHEMRSNTHIELEFFVHGALCVSFSGQCYLSQARQGRSANRGECSQPCRLPYTLTDSSGCIIDQDKYLLSLKDLNLSEYLRELIAAGISSFKIEGRLKDVNYVKNVTAFYRQRIDEILEKDGPRKRASSGKTSVAFRPDPSKTFNRGFTEHFVRRRSKDILSSDTPKSTGAYLGKVKQVERKCIILETGSRVHNGDGICFFDEQNILRGTNVNKVEGKKIFPSEQDGLEIGTAVYRNYDYAFAKELQANKTKRLIFVKVQFVETQDGFAVHMEDEDGVKIHCTAACDKNPAKNEKEAEETVRRQFSKLGGSIFACEEMKIAWGRPYFLPVSICNTMRREGIRLLEDERMKHYNKHISPLQPNNELYPDTQLDYSANVANKKAEAFYRRHGVERIERAFELQRAAQGRTVMTMKHCLRFQYGLCTGKNISNAEPLFLQDAKNRYRLEFDCDVCQMRIVSE
jgi:putative protease